jgi:hypothetical protein
LFANYGKQIILCSFKFFSDDQLPQGFGFWKEHFEIHAVLLQSQLHSGLQIEGVLAYFMHLIRQKRIGDDVGDFKYVFTKKKKKLFCENDPPDAFYPPYYARI